MFTRIFNLSVLLTSPGIFLNFLYLLSIDPVDHIESRAQLSLIGLCPTYLLASNTWRNAQEITYFSLSRTRLRWHVRFFCNVIYYIVNKRRYRPTHAWTQSSLASYYTTFVPHENPLICFLHAFFVFTFSCIIDPYIVLNMYSSAIDSILHGSSFCIRNLVPVSDIPALADLLQIALLNISCFCSFLRQLNFAELFYRMIKKNYLLFT